MKNPKTSGGYLTIRLSDALRKRVDRIAEGERRSVSNLARLALEQYVAEKEKTHA